MLNGTIWKTGIVCGSVLLGTTNLAEAEIINPVVDLSQVDVEVVADVQFDSATGEYIYNYTLTASTLSQLDVETFALETEAEIISPADPTGWVSYMFDNQPIYAWFASQVDLPPDYVNDGNVPPSSVSIKPGETLAGFSFRSTEAPTVVTYYLRGYAPLPSSDEEGDFAGIVVPAFTENAFVGTILGPGRADDLIFTGGRRPSVDGFLGFVGVVNRQTFQDPFSLTIRFATNGEEVDQSTFTAELNRVDVSGLFQHIGNNEMVAIFSSETVPLEVGRNVLKTSVDGTVPGTTRTGTDTDAYTFFIQ